MVDADDPAIGRVDEVTDPTALTESEIRKQLAENPNLSGAAVREFADQIADRRDPVQDEARELLRNRIAKNPANPSVIQLRTQDGRLGPKVPDAGAGPVDLNMSDGGRVTATLEGETVELGSVDVNQGASGYQRAENRWSTKKHPEQQGRGR